MIQFFNISFWTWLAMSPADLTRAWFREWNEQTRVR